MLPHADQLTPAQLVIVRFRGRVARDIRTASSQKLSHQDIITDVEWPTGA